MVWIILITLFVTLLAVVIVSIMAFLVNLYFLRLPAQYCHDSRKQIRRDFFQHNLRVYKYRVLKYFGLETIRSGRGNFTKPYNDVAEPYKSFSTAEDFKIGTVPVRLYRPTEINQQINTSCIFFLYGGGFVFGSIAVSDSFSRRLCYETRTVIITVQYSSAPEFPYPAALNDCVSVIKHVLRDGHKLNIDSHRVAVLGSSSGANLAAAVALKLRDEDFHPQLKLSIICYPGLQILDLHTPSIYQYTGVYPIFSVDVVARQFSSYMCGDLSIAKCITKNHHVPSSVRKEMMTKYLNYEKLPKKYLVKYPTLKDLQYYDEKVWEKIKDKIFDPYFSPIFAEDLSGLPKTFVLTAELDGMRDEGLLFVMKLREAGNDVTHYHEEIGLHGMLTWGFALPETKDTWKHVNEVIDKHL